MNLQTQAIAAAKESDTVTQAFADNTRQGLIVASHAADTGLATALTTLATEYAA